MAEGARETITIALPGGLDLSGRVVDPEGRPLEAAEVWVSLPGRRDAGRVHARTDRFGRFSAKGVDPDAWIGARAAGFRPSRMRWCRDAWESGDLQLQVRMGSGFHGRVVDARESPVSGATIQVTHDPIPPRRDRHGELVLSPGVASATTDSLGRFALPETQWAAAWV